LEIVGDLHWAAVRGEQLERDRRFRTTQAWRRRQDEDVLELQGRDNPAVRVVVEPGAFSGRKRKKERGVAIESSRDVWRHVLLDAHVVQTPRAGGCPARARLSQ